MLKTSVVAGCLSAAATAHYTDHPHEHPHEPERGYGAPLEADMSHEGMLNGYDHHQHEHPHEPEHEEDRQCVIGNSVKCYRYADELEDEGHEPDYQDEDEYDDEPEEPAYDEPEPERHYHPRIAHMMRRYKPEPEPERKHHHRPRPQPEPMRRGGNRYGMPARRPQPKRRQE